LPHFCKKCLFKGEFQFYRNVLRIEVEIGEVVDGRISHERVQPLLLVLEFLPGGLSLLLCQIFVDLGEEKYM
jgi:hypothetical protein